jgi:pimeloyl-ACP methyl ester carboxylesterase
MGDIALRQIIAQTHEDALSESIEGWVDDVVALGSPWEFDLSSITVPVLLWHGGDDTFSPPSHTRWLAKRINTSEPALPPGIAHFGAIEILPEILAWVLGKASTVTPPRTRFADHSERLRVDDAQQPVLAASSRARVRMLGSKQYC